jgi:hypothetical protein
VAVMAAVLALVALDLFDDSFNRWFDRHAFATDVISTFLGLAVTVLVIDRVAERRRLRARSQVMAAQATMVAGQAMRAQWALTAALDGSGERGAAGEELRTFMTMMLTAGPVLMDAPQTRLLLEQSQRLAGEIARALALTRSGGHADDLQARLASASDRVRDALQPLLQTLDPDQRSAISRAMGRPDRDRSSAA